MYGGLALAHGTAASVTNAAGAAAGATWLGAANNSATTTEVVGMLGMVGIAVVAILLLVLFVSALVSISKNPNYHTGGKALWALVCFAFPLLGPLVWFGFGKNSSM